MDFPEILRGSMWHTTTPERYQSIIEAGSLLPEPDLPDSERWGTGRGREYYYFVRSIGGISLFDFREFNEVEYSEEYPNSMWRNFVPYCPFRADAAIWIEINLSMIQEGFIEGKSLLSQWKESGQLYRNIMPVIEAAHIGPINFDAFSRILLYEKSTNAFSELPLPAK